MTIDEKRLAEIRARHARFVGLALEGVGPVVAEIARDRLDLLTMLVAMRDRAEDAERKLAALHAAAAGISLVMVDGYPCIRGGVALTQALVTSSAVAERHDRDVRVKELRRLADGLGRAELDAADLRDEADRIERGEA